MPYVKCVPCRIRVSVADTGTDPSCPGCGLALEPVGKLAELMGFRSAQPLDESIPALIAQEIGLELPPRT
jgi:hypothetical protein